MISVGLTGSIGMGKTTVTQMFAALGAHTWDADSAVHRLYAAGGAAVAPLAERFPDAVVDGSVDRERLSALVLDDEGALADLEAIVHPLVAADRVEAMTQAARAGADAIILDVPLLFEKGLHAFVDAVIVVSASADIQRARVLARPGMTEKKLLSILSRQTPDAVKRRQADYLIDTGVGLDETRRQTARVWADLMKRARERSPDASAG